uniref:Ig-like domain-containing protein n=1 Tax=Strigamia maritima TaxID=126957 RepID=T1JE33_STRMM
MGNDTRLMSQPPLAFIGAYRSLQIQMWCGREWVAWFHYDRQAILTVHHSVITRNNRVSVTHTNHHRTWLLHLRNVKEQDAGRYMCQINTEPAKMQFGYLSVVVPPDIIDSETSSEVITREGLNVTLTCRAKGTPTPTIKWRREDFSKFQVAKGKTVVELFGEVLEITRVSRLHMGAFLCIASNGVPPSVSKRITLKVDFAPMLWIPHQLVGTPRSYETTLECHTEAFPRSINYWMREDGDMIFSNEKYETNNTEELYSRHMHLRIKNLSKKDYGLYKCIAKNPLGETEGVIRVYETEAPSTLPTTTVNAIYERIEGEDHTRNKNENFTNYKNPSSLIVHEHEQEIRYKLNKGKSNKQDENMAIKPPNDWSQSAHDEQPRLQSWSTLLIVHLLAVLLPHFIFCTIHIS